MIAFLTSSPCVYLAPRAIINPENDFLENLASCLRPHPRCLYICSSPDDPDHTDYYCWEIGNAFREAGIAFSELIVLDRRNQDDAQLLIWQADLIILAGGHVPTQNAFFREIGLKELLSDFQGVLLGISAGTMNAAERVYVQPEEAGESDPDFERFLPGLGITHVNVLPHYQQVKDRLLDGKRLFEDITYADSMGECFFAFVDGTYLLIDGDQTLLYGEAYCIQDGQIQQISQTGDVTVLEESL